MNNLQSIASRFESSGLHELDALIGRIEQEVEQEEKGLQLLRMYPDSGALRRELYPKHLEFFAAAAKHLPMEGCPPGCNGEPHKERAAIMPNRVGKSTMGSYEVSLHMTGLYPSWWNGRKFTKPTRWWCAGKTSETTRDIIQQKLFGDVRHEENKKRVTGNGMIPLKCIGHITWKPGLPNLIDIAMVKHVSGGWSVCGFKCYEQGRGAFEGTEQDGIWFDEEPAEDVYEEALMRTLTTDGLVMLTFTPLAGMSRVVMNFLNIRPEDS